MSLSADHTALFERIMEDPDDDAPRLIYSDILEESGDEDRATFIRLQIQSHRMGSNDPKRLFIQRQIQALELEHGMKWINELPQVPGVHWEIFERGFISTVRIEKPERLFEHAEKLFASTPIIRLRLHQFYSPDVQQLSTSPFLEHLHELDMEDGCRAGNAGVEALMTQAPLRKLRVLRLPNNNLGPAAVEAISSSSYSDQLLFLDLSRNALFDDGIGRLNRPSSTQYIRLKQLLIGHCQITATGLENLFRNSPMSSLENLHLSNNPLGERALIPLTAQSQFLKLRALLADSCGVTDGPFQRFVDQARMPNLDWLYLRGNNLTDRSAEYLANSDRFPNLREVNLGDNAVTRFYLDALRRRFGDGVIVD